MSNPTHKTTLLEWSDFNMTSEWSWKIYLIKKDGGTYSVSGEQTEPDSQEIFYLPVLQFSNGSELKNAIQVLFQNDNLVDTEIDWVAISNNLRKFDPTFASELDGEVLEASKRDSDDEGEEDDPANEHIYNLIAKSSWDKSSLRDPLGMGASIDNSSRKSAIFQYISEYLLNSGQLPHGKHLIDVPEVPQLSRKPQKLEVIFPDEVS